MTKLRELSLGSTDAGRLAGLMKCEHPAASFLAGCLEGCGQQNRSFAGNRLCQRWLTKTAEVVRSVRS
jgi:hypothetical protein